MVTTEPTLSELIFDTKPKEGDFGIEIEIETEQGIPNTEAIRKNWRVVREGSLRYGYELVSRKPIPFPQLPRQLREIRTFLDDNKVEIKKSDRAGIHIHMNVGDLTPFELLKFLCLYYICEEVIIDTCGPNRIGNYFCLRARDAEQIILDLEHSLKANDLYHITTEQPRYAALNLQSIFSFGSVEFRAIQTTKVFRADILRIARILKNLKDAAVKTYSTPEEIMMKFSLDGPENFFRGLFTRKSTVESITNVPGLEEKLIRGMYMAQDLAWASEQPMNNSFNWGLVMGEEVKENPHLQQQEERERLIVVLRDLIREEDEDNEENIYDLI